MNTDHNSNYVEIVKLVVSDLKRTSKDLASQSLVWRGDSCYTEKQLSVIKVKRKKMKKAAAMLLASLKTLGY